VGTFVGTPFTTVRDMHACVPVVVTVLVRLVATLPGMRTVRGGVR
jgi:hypothetical protein